MPRGVRASRPYVRRFEPLVAAVRAANVTHFTHEFLAELAGLNDIGRSRPLVKRLVDAGVIVPLVRGIFVHAAPERPRPSLATLINWRCGWHDGHLAYASAIRVHDREGSLAEGTLYVRTPWVAPPHPMTPSLTLVTLSAGIDWKHSVAEVPVEGLEPMLVTDTLSTAFDGLLRPELCGGFLRVVRFVAKHQATWTDAQIIAIAAAAPQPCTQRLGYLLRLCGRDVPAKLRLKGAERDRRALNLDPRTSRVPGRADSLWRINVNVDRTALNAACAGSGSGPAPA